MHTALFFIFRHISSISDSILCNQVNTVERKKIYFLKNAKIFDFHPFLYSEGAFSITFSEPFQFHIRQSRYITFYNEQHEMCAGTVAP